MPKKGVQEKEPCPFCDQPIGKSGLNNHIIYCQKNPDRIAYVPPPQPAVPPPQPVQVPISQEDIEAKKMENQADKERSTVERQTRRARLTAKLKKIRKNLRRAPKELEDDADELREVVSVHLKTLKSPTITETQLDEIESVLEDDIELDYDEILGDMKLETKKPENAMGAQFEHWQKTGSLDGAPSGNSAEDYALFLEERRMNLDMVKQRRLMELEKQKLELENLRNQAKPREPVADEKKSRLLPNEQTVMMTDKEYADYLLQWERIEASKRAEKEGVVEFPVPDGHGGISKMKIPSSQVPMFQQLFYKQDDPQKDLKELLKQQADTMKHMEENAYKKELEEIKAQMQFDPQRDWLERLDMMQQKFPNMMSSTDRSVQVVMAEAQKDFQNAAMGIIADTTKSMNQKTDMLINTYLASQEEGWKEKAVAKARKKALEIEEPKSPTKKDIEKLIRDMELQEGQADEEREAAEAAKEQNAPIGGFQVLGGKKGKKKKDKDSD